MTESGVKPRSRPKTRTYRDKRLVEIGQRVHRARLSKGLSIDRLARASDGLSVSVIHRIETGTGAVTLLSLLRVADALGVEASNFLLENWRPVPRTTSKVKVQKIFAPDELPRFLPVFSLEASAGSFGKYQAVNQSGFIQLDSHQKFPKDSFVVQARGNSMSPKIQDGQWVVFAPPRTNTPKGMAVLVEYRTGSDPETGGSYTIKIFDAGTALMRPGQLAQNAIVLRPLNPDYESIVIPKSQREKVRLIGEFVAVLE